MSLQGQHRVEVSVMTSLWAQQMLMHRISCLIPILMTRNDKQAPVAQLVECLLRGKGGHGFDPGPRHTKVIKNAALCLALRLTGRAGTGWRSVRIIWLIISSVFGMILQWGSTIKVSIELPVADRHCRDMTEKLLKVTLNRNKQQQQYWITALLTYKVQVHAIAELDPGTTSKNEGHTGTVLGNREHRKSRFQFWVTGEQSNLLAHLSRRLIGELIV